MPAYLCVALPTIVPPLPYLPTQVQTSTPLTDASAPHDYPHSSTRIGTLAAEQRVKDHYRPLQ